MNLLIGIKPARGRAYIKHIETEDTYRGGRILIPDQARDKVSRQQFEVVSVGDYERCEDEDECPRHHTKRGEHKHYLQVGDWILARNRSWMDTPDPSVYVIRQSDILGVFRESQ